MFDFKNNFKNLYSFKFPIFLKKGNKIKIKKENRGKFTEYCNGEVTNECILRGKNSSNSKIRKRAIFALNSRLWKHKVGGSIRERFYNFKNFNNG